MMLRELEEDLRYVQTDKSSKLTRGNVSIHQARRKKLFCSPPQSVGEITILPLTLHFALLTNMRTDCLPTIQHSDSCHFSKTPPRLQIVMIAKKFLS